MTSFTLDGRPEAEARVAADLGRIVEEVRRHAGEEGDELLAILLLGGYARGEGTVIRILDGSLRGFNDYDLLLVLARPPRRAEGYGDLSRRLAAALGIDFVDLGLATTAQLRVAPPTLFWYELGEAHRVLWSGGGAAVALPRFRPDRLDRAEGSRLLLNRGMALLWARLRLDPAEAGGGSPPSADLSFIAIAAHKAVLAAGDAALLRLGAYSIRQDERMRAVEDLSRGDSGLAVAYAAAVTWKRAPATPDAATAGRLWTRSRALHEAGFRDAETWRLGRPFATWGEHAARARRDALRRRVAHPRLGLRSLRAAAAGREFFDAEETGFMRLPGLLYADPAPEARRAWRAAARALVDRWHP